MAEETKPVQSDENLEDTVICLKEQLDKQYGSTKQGLTSDDACIYGRRQQVGQWLTC